MQRLLVLCSAASALRLAPRLAPPRLAKAPAVAAAPKAKRVAQVAAVASLALLAPQPASASHLADVVSAKLRASGFADAWIVATIAAMPVVELRGAIPVGAMMGMPLPKVFFLCVAGNMVPIAPLLLALRSNFVQKLLDKPLSKARAKAGAVSGNARWTALAAFVGVPFPGTGAWTGAMVAFVLGMPFSEAMSSIFAGVIVAGLIMSSLAAAGAKGAAAVVTAITAAFLWKAAVAGPSEDAGASDADAAEPAAE